jgi:hypothetical protein
MVVNMDETMDVNICVNMVVRRTVTIGVNMDVNGMRWYLGFYGMELDGIE